MAGASDKLAIGLTVVIGVTLVSGPALGDVVLRGEDVGDRDGDLLSTPSSPSEGLYWRLNDNHKVEYDPITKSQTDKGEIEGSTSGVGWCSSDDLSNGPCEEQDGVCNWNAANGREWYEPDETGNYHETDFVYGRCAALIIWEESGTIDAIGRSAVQTTLLTDDPNCPTCDDVTGNWNFTVGVRWLDSSGDPLGDWKVMSRSETCFVESTLFGEAVYADCVFGGLGVEDLSSEAPADAAGFKIRTRFVNDGDVMERALIDCAGCLT